MRNGRRGSGRQGGAWSVSLLEPVTFPGSAGARPPFAGPSFGQPRSPSQRPRVYQLRKGRPRRTAADRNAGRASVIGGAGESTAPGAASAARAGVGCLVLLGDPPSFDEDDSDPHCCVKPQRCSCLAVACGDRGVSFDMGRRPLVRRRWRRGRGIFAARPGCLPGPRDRLGRLDSLGFDQGLCFVPSRPASFPKVSRRRRLPCLGCPRRPSK